jgi:riboflavin biosynthesis pyrimidine reductase
MRWILRTESADTFDQVTTPSEGSEATAPCGKDVDTPVDRAVLDPADLLPVIAAEPRPAPPDRPWIVLNMVASVDGASTGAEGKSRSLSSEADRALFAALRSIADVVFAGAETIRTENYGAPRLVPGADQLRAERGQAPLPRMATASLSLGLDAGARLFQEVPDDQPAVVLTSAEALAQVETTNPELARVAELIGVGEHSVDWPEAFRELQARYGARLVLAEGGPRLNAQLVEHDLVDELCLTVAPVVVGGGSRRIMDDAQPSMPHAMELTRVFEDDGFLLLRYVRRR